MSWHVFCLQAHACITLVGDCAQVLIMSEAATCLRKQADAAACKSHPEDFDAGTAREACNW